MSGSIKSVLSTQKPGALIRLFSMKPEQVESNVTGAMKLIARLTSAQVEGLPAFREIHMVIFADKRFESRADCGATEPAMRDAVKAAGLERDVRIESVAFGDLNWGILNHGFSGLHQAGCRIIASISPQSVGVCTDENLARVYEAFAKGAKASCLAVYDLEGICQGNFTNASTWWDAQAHAAVGGFDEAASMRADERRVLRASGWHPDLGALDYPGTGVEEIAPLLRIVEGYGECLAPIVPEGMTDATIAYDLPDRTKFPDLWSRKVTQLVTKRPRQNLIAMSIGRDLTCLKRAVMKEYRRSPYWERPVTLEMKLPL